VPLRSRFGLASAVAALLLFFKCTCSNYGLDTKTFACRTSQDCTQGWVCDPTTLTCIRSVVDGGAVPDGGLAADASSGADAGLDSGFDAGLVADSGADAGVASVDSGVDSGTWCQVHAPGEVCFDYDEPDAGLLNPQITCTTDGSPCTVGFGPAPDNDSPPDALVVSLPQLGPYPDNASAKDAYTWPTGIGTASIAFDTRADATYGVILAALDWGGVLYTIAYGGNGTTAFPEGDLVVDEQAYVDAGIPPVRYFANVADAGLDATQWHRFVLTVSASAQTVTLTLDGVSVLAATTQNIPLSGDVAFEWGVGYVNGPFSGPTKYHFDNVVLIGSP
jgi:hypothetical protein